MKKYLSLILVSLSIIACSSQNTSNMNQAKIRTTTSLDAVPMEQNDSKTRSLIVFYDPSVISTENLDALVKQQSPEMVYVYNNYNFNAITIYVPQYHNFERIKAFFKRQVGILSVDEDRVLQLQ